MVLGYQYIVLKEHLVCPTNTDPIYLDLCVPGLCFFQRDSLNKIHLIAIYVPNQDAERFANMMAADPNFRQLFYAFMVCEGLDMLSVAQNLAVNNAVRRVSHRCKL